ncbi:MAG: hypothetical protein ACM3JI_05815 [Anaerolineae bacterium]
MSLSSIMSKFNSGVDFGIGEIIRDARHSLRSTGYVSYVTKKLKEFDLEATSEKNKNKIAKACSYITKEKENILNEMKTHPDRLKKLQAVVDILSKENKILIGTKGSTTHVEKFKEIQSFVKEAHADIFPKEAKLEKKIENDRKLASLYHNIKK